MDDAPTLVGKKERKKETFLTFTFKNQLDQVYFDCVLRRNVTKTARGGSGYHEQRLLLKQLLLEDLQLSLLLLQLVSDKLLRKSKVGSERIAIINKVENEGKMRGVGGGVGK